jgi:hypothetical protein
LSRSLFRSGLALLATGLLLALGAGQSLAEEQPSIAITAPAEGEVLPGPDITVSVALSGFTISLPLEPKREPNKGHIVYFLDVAPSCDLPIPLGDDNIIHSGRLSETFAGVADGEHAIYVCLVYDDNTCIDPALTDSVRISVGAPPTATPPPEATPTPEPPQETPTPAPTEQPPPLETPPPTLSPVPSTPSPTTQPPTAEPPTPVATPAPGIAPGRADESETGLSLWHAGVAGAVALIVAGALALWWMERSRGRP